MKVNKHAFNLLRTCIIKIFFSSIFVLLFSYSWAKQIDESTARLVAFNFLTKRVQNSGVTSMSNLEVTYKSTFNFFVNNQMKEYVNFYVFNFFHNSYFF